MPKLVFAPIDAKDFYGGYTPIAIGDRCTLDGRPYSKNNTKILYQAVNKYLVGLKKLQEEIAEEFNPLLENDAHIDPNKSFCQSECICSERYCEQCKKGFENLYYT
jgi:hypothetical protein